MKQILSITMLFCSYICSVAQIVSLKVDNQTPGWLSSKISYPNQQIVEDISITGYINSTDLSFIGTLIQKQNLHKIDLSEVVIVGENKLKDNDISYDNIFGLQKSVNINYLALPKSITTPIPQSNVKPLKYIEVDTLIYGSANCSIYNNALWGFIYAGGSGAASSPTHLILRDGVTSIAEYSFDNYKYNSYGGNVKIKTVTSPNSLQLIGKCAFRECTTLNSINLPDSIETIEQLAFEKSSFTPDTLKLPNSLKIYYTNSFPIKNGQVIELGDSVTSFNNESWCITTTTKATFIINRVIPPTFRKGKEIGDWSSSFSDGKELSGCTIYVPKAGYSFYIDPKYDSVGGSSGQWSGWSNPYSHATIKIMSINPSEILLNKNSLTLTVGEELNLMAEIKPSTADNKNIYWASSNTYVAQVNSNGLVTAINKGSVIITATTSNGLTASCTVNVVPPTGSIDGIDIEIAPGGGENGEDLAKVIGGKTDPNGTLRIPDEIEIDGKKYPVTEISEAAFKNRTDIKKLIIPASVVKIGKESFAGCTNLIEVEAEDGEKLLDCGTDVFKGVPIATLYLGRDTSGLPFTGKDSLTNLIFGDKVTSIGTGDFGGCSSIKNITVLATVPPTLPDNGFEQVVYKNVSLRIPDTSTDDYRKADGWKNFFDILGINEIRPIEITMELADVELAEGESTTLKAIITPENATDKSVTWKSSDDKIASVDANGLVTAIKEGTAIITATTANGLTASCDVIVKAKPAGIDGFDSEGDNAIRVEGGSIIAPEGSELYDLNGRRVATSGLRPGIYIVRIPGGKVVKVVVK